MRSLLMVLPSLWRLPPPNFLHTQQRRAPALAWYFTLRGCLLYSGDVERVTQIINGGQNGIKDRRERYAKAKAALV